MHSPFFFFFFCLPVGIRFNINYFKIIVMGLETPMNLGVQGDFQNQGFRI